MRNRTRKAIGINGNFEILTIYTPKSSKYNYELITSVKNNGNILSTAHQYKGEYSDRIYVDDVIKLIVCTKKDNINVDYQHERAYKLLKMYNKNKIK